MKEILFVLLEEYADWEAASLAAALNQLENFTVKTVSNTKQPVHSMGGFTTLPDYTLAEAEQIDFEALILIGGKSWRTNVADEVASLVKKAEQKGTIIAAICDATVYAGTLGLLNEVKHTSNQLPDLKAYAGQKYTGENHYLDVQAVRDKNIITANGTGHLEFAQEVLLALQAMSEAEIAQWYDFYKLGYYEAMKKS
ncbi:type 1 glutamine amidotransferase family protein [Enterococcus wangshanyuanii]|uniref:Glutamine amidotransferase n=1 Tax=Enterococcus wangshanyuanii TaxID=2005703 RepID=A0ABQ1P389_9ENTE|nr:type 1 glutamine amidotransferase family protein [Enterococcus wangshanyuanii]GGC89468.1 glutamine amidotransferase [Enterococcus wangshanyuanii]